MNLAIEIDPQQELLSTTTDTNNNGVGWGILCGVPTESIYSLQGVLVVE